MHTIKLGTFEKALRVNINATVAHCYRSVRPSEVSPTATFPAAVNGSYICPFGDIYMAKRLY
jgi:hypothetical protein